MMPRVLVAIKRRGDGQMEGKGDDARIVRIWDRENVHQTDVYPDSSHLGPHAERTGANTWWVVTPSNYWVRYGDLVEAYMTAENRPDEWIPLPQMPSSPAGEPISRTYTHDPRAATR
jgi:hypothetical protein